MPHIEILEKKFEFFTQNRSSQSAGYRSKSSVQSTWIYVVGDLADAPIIKVALQQGFDVAQHVCSTLEHSKSFDIDIAIIGAGPAGIGASLACKEHHRLQHVLVEKTDPFIPFKIFQRERKSLQNQRN